MDIVIPKSATAIRPHHQLRNQSFMFAGAGILRPARAATAPTLSAHSSPQFLHSAFPSRTRTYLPQNGQRLVIFRGPGVP